ncbi:hypothetical protein ACVAMH_31695 [Bacillus zanthoxyli]|uniref:hypothetical protein n=1 Tax=Bacillus cereus group TaxID=86661 RepID=UPI000B43AB10|nr:MULTISPECIES: hypothetical protein [Bacillus cereus group]MBU4643003.1 hypothetical protein [Bacillus toyonensis]OTW70080.1 hypothetical protein BK707_13445 [Bacillus thuringiensis serovar coreanensis]OTX54809.1 hypothetical protein BK725_11920 [Bacillus thuringiensis serovar guiyangiensis]PFY14317.1 hypothetical protein COL47_22880 [Bacillus toyonensis]
MNKKKSQSNLKILKLCSLVFIVMIIFSVGDILGSIIFNNDISLKAILLILAGTGSLIFTKSKIKKINI